MEVKEVRILRVFSHLPKLFNENIGANSLRGHGTTVL